MSSDDVWATCGECGAVLLESDKLCPRCGSTKKAYRREVTVKLGVSVSTGVKHKRKGKGTLIEMIGNRWKRSGDPKLEGGVREGMVVDRERDEYHHMVKDAATGQVIHEEHEQLSKHHKKGG